MFIAESPNANKVISQGTYGILLDVRSKLKLRGSLNASKLDYCNSQASTTIQVV
jgi:hypothetical protein